MESDLTKLDQLVQPSGGLFKRVTVLEQREYSPSLFTSISHFGSVSCTLEATEPPVSPTFLMSGAGSGTALTADESRFIALIEGLERYSSSRIEPKQIIWSSQKELGCAALDLNSIPQCSARELARGCPLHIADPDTPIRWIKGIALRTGRTIYLPAIMCFTASYASEAERFWFPISTGAAAHYSYEEAIVNGILEVVERDILSIVWLQKLALPRIDMDTPTVELDTYLRAAIDSSPAVTYHFFDATLDLGIPAVYGVRIDRAAKCATLVSCSVKFAPADAIVKVIRELASIGLALRDQPPPPEAIEDCRGMHDGALYTGRLENLGAFDFLLKHERAVKLSDLRTYELGCPKTRLKFLIKRLNVARLDSYVVDVSSDEAIRAGIKVVQVLVPGLQPMSFHHRARYLGNPRLYAAPGAAGYDGHPEEELNRWPNPFA